MFVASPLLNDSLKPERHREDGPGTEVQAPAWRSRFILYRKKGKQIGVG